MPRQLACAGLLILAAHVLPGNEQSSRARTAPSNTERRELPREEQQTLRAQALVQAKVRLSPRIKNPNISRDGLDPAVLKALEEQQAYLEAQGSAMSGARSTERTRNPRLLPQPPAKARELAPAPGCHGPMIRSVNGRGKSAVFTPQTQNNFYRIEGCSFGSVPGQVQLEPHPVISGRSASPIILQLANPATAWSDNEIDAHLDPHLSGIPDYPVTLAIYRGNRQRVELPGCFFVAARGEPQLLRTIPSAWVKLHASAVRSRPAKQLEYVSPPVKGGDVPGDAAGTSAFVVRADSEQFGMGRDTYDFSHLNPGWVADSVQLQTYTVSCPGIVTRAQSFGSWDMRWVEHTLAVTWEEDVCTSYVAPSFVFKMSLSLYAANVWVVGPVGTQPVPTVFLR